MMTAAEMREESARVERDRATHCPECDREFTGRVRKARGIADHERPGYQPCVECAEELFGETNQAGEPFADDDTLQDRAERAHEDFLSAYYGGGSPMNDQERAEVAEQRRDFRSTRSGSLHGMLKSIQSDVYARIRGEVER